MLPGMSGIGGFAATDPYFFQSYTAGESALSTSLTLDKPVGTVSGDLLVALMTSSSDGITFTGASGWTEILDSAATPSLRAAYLVAGGSEPSNYTFTASSSSTCVGHILCFRGLQFDVASASMSTLTGDGGLSIAAITAAGGILIAAAASNQAAGAITHSTPAGFTKVATTIKTTNGQPAISSFYKTVSAGSTGSVSTTVGGTTVENGGILIAIKP
jgi:hypothetical protein